MILLIGRKQAQQEAARQAPAVLIAAYDAVPKNPSSFRSPQRDMTAGSSAVCLSSLITLFAISAACILPMDGTEILQIMVSYFSVGTSVTLGMLLRRKEAESKPSRQKLKTWLLGGLGFTWIGFTCGLTATNESVCGPFYFWPSPVAQCALYTIVDMLSYGLVITLLAAAYATHRRSPVQDDEKMAPSAGHLIPVGA
ncbi:hypothetical protein B0H11DRAFT_1256957 [Mycena galericulata]|nr:hypothetical protein B0H11DRAFT_1256957 [Mycena galericulata]